MKPIKKFNLAENLKKKSKRVYTEADEIDHVVESEHPMKYFDKALSKPKYINLYSKEKL